MSQIPIKNPKKRVTMIKHVVGKVRTQPDPIPNITFGIPNKIDAEGAGNVIQSWAQSQPPTKNNNNNNNTISTATTPMTDMTNNDTTLPPTSSSSNMPLSSSPMIRHFPSTNRKALKNGCLDAKSQREFALKNPVMKSLMKHHLNHSHHLDLQKKKNLEPVTTLMAYQHQQHYTSCYDKDHQQQQHVFGIKSIANDVPIQELLKSVHGDFEESDYPDRSHMQKKGRLPPAKSTNASRLLEASIHNSSSSSSQEKTKMNKDCFKMKRFLKVDSTVKAMLQQ